jgi:nucleotide-binding universal stress UspA family protein
MTRQVALVPLDGSATAEYVLPIAVATAKALDLWLVLAQFVRDAQPGDDAHAREALRPARHYLDGVVASLHGAGVVLNTRALTAGDDIAAGITSAAHTEDAALIMLATHGRTGVRRLVMGSVADAVIRSATLPVLVVRARPGTPTSSGHEAAIRRILAPVDGSTAATAALAEAVKLARGAGAVLDIVQVAPWSWSLMAGATDVAPPEGLDAQLEAGAAEYLARVQAELPADVRQEQHVLRGDPAASILDYADTSHADLIAMGTRGRSPVTRWALGSVADRVVRSGTHPVLLVRATPSISA